MAHHLNQHGANIAAGLVAFPNCFWGNEFGLGRLNITCFSEITPQMPVLTSPAAKLTALPRAVHRRSF